VPFTVKTCVSVINVALFKSVECILDCDFLNNIVIRKSISIDVFCHHTFMFLICTICEDIGIHNSIITSSSMHKNSKLQVSNSVMSLDGRQIIGID